MWSYGWTRPLFVLLVVVLINQFLYCESHRSSINNQAVEGTQDKYQTPIPPCRILSRVVRGSKLLRSSRNLAPSPSLKSPVYRMRFGGRFSQFHHAPSFNIIDESGSSPSLDSPDNRDEDEEIVTGPVEMTSRTIDDDRDNDFDLTFDNPTPSFTPFISARALTNMGKFFEHLQENVLAMQQQESINEIGQPARRQMINSDLTDPDAMDSFDNSKKYSDSSEFSETVTIPSTDLTWPAPASRFFRLSQVNNNKGHGNSNWSLQNKLSSGSGKLHNINDPWVNPEEGQLKRNRYNPSWTWTNMGLGKRRRRDLSQSQNQEN